MEIEINMSSKCRLLGQTGFQVSPVGFGCYRIDEDHPEHEAALELALLSGVNLIDTSTNYTDGSSERLVGKVVERLLQTNKVKRKGLFVVTKVGYVQGENLESARERLGSGHPFSEMVQFSPDLWHCISPDFLEDQITRSLARLKLAQVDCVLLHNPEYFLKKEDDHAEYYRRIKKAFDYLETEVGKKRIRFYGISSNTFPLARDDEEYTSLETILALSQELPKPSHFAVIQFPFNLFEIGAALEPNNSGKTVLELAQANHLGVLINRPLNAFHEGAMIRLADFPSHQGVDTVALLQNTLRDALLIESRNPNPDRDALRKASWAHVIKDNLNRITDLDRWRHILAYQIQPSLTDTKTLWEKEHSQALEKLCAALTAELEARAAMTSKKIELALKMESPLSQSALRIYLSFEEINSVLVGMRKITYVQDSIAGACLPPLAPTEKLNTLKNASKFV